MTIWPSVCKKQQLSGNKSTICKYLKNVSLYRNICTNYRAFITFIYWI